MECVEKIIKKDMVDPTNSKTLTDKDIIALQRVRLEIVCLILQNGDILIQSNVIILWAFFYDIKVTP